MLLDLDKIVHEYLYIKTPVYTRDFKETGYIIKNGMIEDCKLYVRSDCTYSITRTNLRTGKKIWKKQYHSFSKAMKYKVTYNIDGSEMLV
jgi:hypothetical protein